MIDNRKHDRFSANGKGAKRQKKDQGEKKKGTKRNYDISTCMYMYISHNGYNQYVLIKIKNETFFKIKINYMALNGKITDGEQRQRQASGRSRTFRIEQTSMYSHCPWKKGHI